MNVENYVIFSALDPQGHIAPHHATYNWTFNVHLGLIVPDDCALRVKGEAGREISYIVETRKSFQNWQNRVTVGSVI